MTLLSVLAGGIIPVMGGCSNDSFLYDPSVLGRWERTPTTVPILSRIASIEGPADEWVEFTEPTAADLVPDVTEYRIGPGDRLNIVLYDLPDEGKATPYDKIVDTRGAIDLPQLGTINLNGLTVAGASDFIKEKMKDLVNQPLATVDVLQPRQQRISVLGSVQTPGQYTVPAADYRLLEALTAAGGFSEAPEYIYVIRQAPLSDTTNGRPKAAGPVADPNQPAVKPGAEKLLDIIDQIAPSKPGAQNPPATGNPPAPQNPASGGPPGPGAPPANPAPANPAPANPAPTGPAAPKPGGSPGVFQPSTQPAAQPTKAGGQPAIDLIDPSKQLGAKPVAPQPEPQGGEVSWVHLDGKWVRVNRPAPPAAGAIPGQPTPAAAPLVTQRVIRIPVSRLAIGDARVNVIIRPGDVVRVPPPPSGLVFVSGQVAHPGVYNMSQQLTLQRVISAAGGTNSVAVPERADLTRMLGPDREGIIRLNLRAIAEGTNPDVFLKANDHINIGTDFWATPMAVLRNGFRVTYGFGLLVDRNFGSDIFGVPPESTAGVLGG